MKLKAPENMGNVSHGGQEYPVVDGYADIPEEIIGIIMALFGFILPDKPEAPAGRPKKS